MKKVFVLSFVLLFLLLTACSKDTSDADDQNGENLENINESEMPIVKEPITLNFFAGKAVTSAEDWNDVLVLNEYEDMTNVNVEWDMIPAEGLEEKRNLALASGTLPDAFYSAGMPMSDLLKYGEQGTFIKLNDIIKDHMPNLSAILNEFPELKKGLTFPDGNIYSLPSIHDSEFSSLDIGTKLWIRSDWLKELEMDVPETTDEFYEYLKAVKETDLNGNGEADEIPFGGIGSTAMNGLKGWLAGAFGIQNKGSTQKFIDTDPETGDMRFFPITDGYKEMLQYMNKLYAEELIQQSIYTIETNQSYAEGAEGLYGSTVIWSPETAYGKEQGEKYEGVSALKGPHGDQLFSKVSTPLASIGSMVITKENKDPIATAKWVDYFYSDEGAKLFYMGVEGETYEELENGDVEYLDVIENNPDGLTFAEAVSEYMIWSGGSQPGIVKQDYFKGAESKKPSVEAAEKIEPYFVEEVWPSFNYTIEENQKLTGLATDIEKYVNEMTDKFITGTNSFTEWDNYVEKIQKMGLEEYMEIQEKAYERYKDN